MYDPQAAKKDFHYLTIGVLLIISAIVGLFCWSTSFTGIKYKILTNYGTKTEGTVINVITDGNFTTGELLHNSRAAHFHSDYVFVFNDFDGHTIQTSVTLENDKKQDPETKRWHNVFLFEENEKVELLYFRSWPQIMFPETLLQRLAFDWQLFTTSFLVLCVLITLLFWRIRLLMTFRRSATHY